MNNQQFRRLLLSDAPKQDGSKTQSPTTANKSQAALGARKHSSIPMTPRQVGNRASIQADFARQLAERNAKANPDKKVKVSVPKGTKLAHGYTDRTKLRVDDDDNEIAKRIKNLEEEMKQGEIDRETFDRLVQDITGGDLSTTHLVKGLDRKLLERVRRGEDVLAGEAKEQSAADDQDLPAVEDAFDELAATNVGPIMRAKAEKKGEVLMPPPPPVAGVKRSRNDILEELKRQREEAAAAAAAEHEKRFPALGPGFRKITAKKETSRLEVDDKGREVLIVKGPDGKVKRKVRKQKAEEQPIDDGAQHVDDATKATDAVDANATNMVEAPPSQKEESEDEDIFEGVGSNYNPLANFDDCDDSDDDSDNDNESAKNAEQHINKPANEPPSAQTDHTTTTKDTTTIPPAKRNYFKSSTPNNNTNPSPAPAADATLRAALAKARTLDQTSPLLQNLGPSTQESRLKQRAIQLAAADRDMQDLDLGFGASRFDDADDMDRDGEKVSFSQWKGLGAENDDDDDGGGGMDRAKKQRKRGPRKKRGDKNRVEDVLAVMRRQKGEGEKKVLG